MLYIKEKKTEYITAAERIIEHILQHQKEDKIKLYRYISTNKNEHQSAEKLGNSEGAYHKAVSTKSFYKESFK